MEDWKKEIGRIAMDKGIITDPKWLEHLDEPMPVWAVLEIAIRLMDHIYPPYQSYD